jgi:hypothetical protein
VLVAATHPHREPGSRAEGHHPRWELRRRRVGGDAGGSMMTTTSEDGQGRRPSHGSAREGNFWCGEEFGAGEDG